MPLLLVMPLLSTFVLSSVISHQSSVVRNSFPSPTLVPTIQQSHSLTFPSSPPSPHPPHTLTSTPQFESSCSADKNCGPQGWSVLVYAAQAEIGLWQQAWSNLQALNDTVFEEAGGNGHSRTNSLWYIATRPDYTPLHEYVPLPPIPAPSAAPTPPTPPIAPPPTKVTVPKTVAQQVSIHGESQLAVDMYGAKGPYKSYMDTTPVQPTLPVPAPTTVPKKTPAPSLLQWTRSPAPSKAPAKSSWWWWWSSK